MAIISQIYCSKLERKVRIEAEFYQPKYLRIENIIKSLNSVKIKRIVDKITDGTHFTPTYTNSGVKFFSALNVQENFFNKKKCKYISPQEHALLFKRCDPEQEDILIRKVGVGPRWACVIPKNITDEFSLFVSVALLKKTIGGISPYYISTFINSLYGQNQLLRVQKGMSQPDLHLEDISELRVPIFSTDQMNKIENIVKKGLDSLEQSFSMYNQAQELLEQELGLDKLTFEKPVGYEAKFSDLINSNRLDSQHYRIKYDIIFKEIKKRNWDYLRNLNIYNKRGQQPIYIENGIIDVINSQHIGKQHLDYKKFQKTTLKTFNSLPQAHVKFNDLLIYTTGAYIGNTNVYLSEKPAFASNHVNILRLKDNVDATYLAVVMQSSIGQFQTEKYSRGSAQAELYPVDIDKFIVPIISDDKQKEIGDLSRKSLRLKKQSHELLEQAKQQVEDLIEEAAGVT